MKHFACIADAVVYYYERGYTTINEDIDSGTRVMQNGPCLVYIKHVGLLNVTAEEY